MYSGLCSHCRYNSARRLIDSHALQPHVPNSHTDRTTRMDFVLSSNLLKAYAWTSMGVTAVALFMLHRRLQQTSTQIETDQQKQDHLRAALREAQNSPLSPDSSNPRSEANDADEDFTLVNREEPGNADNGRAPRERKQWRNARHPTMAGPKKGLVKDEAGALRGIVATASEAVTGQESCDM